MIPPFSSGDYHLYYAANDADSNVDTTYRNCTVQGDRALDELGMLYPIVMDSLPVTLVKRM